MRRARCPLALLLVIAAQCLAQQRVAENDLKAELVRRFTMFVEWPATALHGPEFTIGVVGETTLTGSLEALAGRQPIKERRVVVRRITSLDDVDRCHVLFVAASAAAELARILERTGRKPVLTVADTEGWGERGVLVNFYLAERQLRFEINEPAVKASGLEVRAQLYRVARILTGKGPGS